MNIICSSTFIYDCSIRYVSVCVCVWGGGVYVVNVLHTKGGGCGIPLHGGDFSEIWGTKTRVLVH